MCYVVLTKPTKQWNNDNKTSEVREMIGKRLMVHDMFRKARAAVPVERDDGQMVTLHFSQETAGTHQGQKETLGTWMPRRHVACASNDEQSYSRR